MHEVTPVDDGSGKVRVKVVSPEIALSLEAFHELCDVMMVAGVEHRCTFDGFQVDVASVRGHSWWRVW